MIKKFIIRISIFVLIGFFLGESIVRVFQLNVAVPELDIDDNGLIKMTPNQEGQTMWGHKWVVNKFGEYGYEPKKTESIFTVIGDSYIANTINPPSCHQAHFLSLNFDTIDFYPKARGGAGFIEFVIMANSLNSLEPIRHLLYVHHGDFAESITEIVKSREKIQWSAEQDKVIPISFDRRKNKIKRFLYKSKFAYYLYRNYIVKAGAGNTNNRDDKSKDLDYDRIIKLLDYIDKNFVTDNITLVFSPDSDLKLIEITKGYKYDVFVLKSNDYESWSLEDDSHWSCSGHEKASKQVVSYINELLEQR